MRSTLVFITSLGAVLILGLLGRGIAASADPAPVTIAAAEVTGPPAHVPAAEVERIRAHLAAVERELIARDVSHLTAEQRGARARNIAVLREYREAGVFPHNHDFPGERVPYFVDEHGTLCAMAYLVSRSGHEELVQRVANSRNNARIHELAADPELVAWLHDAGLTADEAARIQPMYGCCWIEEPSEDRSRVEPGYAVASALTSGVAGVSIGMNLSSAGEAERSRWPGILGVAAGVTGLAIGFDRLADGGAATALGAANAGVGALSLAMGAWNLFSIPGDRAVKDDAVTASAHAPRITASPLLGATEPVVGLLLRLDF